MKRLWLVRLGRKASSLASGCLCPRTSVQPCAARMDMPLLIAGAALTCSGTGVASEFPFPGDRSKNTAQAVQQVQGVLFPAPKAISPRLTHATPLGHA